MAFEVPSYPELGHVYPGDYDPVIPYDAYIPSRPLPEGEFVVDIRDCGALGDGKTLCTKAFRQAAETLHARGGGTLVVRKGTYVTGTFTLPDHTTLFVAPDAEIRASRNAEDLLQSGEPLHPGESFPGALVHVKGASHVRITGGGRISGSGEWYVHEPKEKPLLQPHFVTKLPSREEKDRINSVPGTVRTLYRERIRYVDDRYGGGKPALRRPSYMVWLEKCTDVEVDGIVLHDAMCWTLNLDTCDRVRVHDLVIDDNRHVANTDGIDITGSSDVEIRHCHISCADDGIVLKNPLHTGRAMRNVHVSDCTIGTVMNALKIGTETVHPIEHVLIEHCTLRLTDIYPGSVSGISIESCDGSWVQDVTVRDIRMDHVLCPIYLCLNMRNRTGDPYTDVPDENRYWGGGIENIRIERITARDAELPCILTGFQTGNRRGDTIRRAPYDVTIRQVEITYRDNQEELRIPDEIPEFLTDYPESNAHGDVSACGIWARHVDQLCVEDVRVTPRSCNTRPVFRFEDVRMKENRD